MEDERVLPVELPDGIDEASASVFEDAPPVDRLR